MVEERVGFLPGQRALEALVRGHPPIDLVFTRGGVPVQVSATGASQGRGGQLEDAPGVEAVNGLHAPFAETARADDGGSAMILQAGRDDLTGAGAAAVDEAD